MSRYLSGLHQFEDRRLRSGVARTFHCPHKHTSLPQIMCMLAVLVLVSNPFAYGKRRGGHSVGRVGAERVHRGHNFLSRSDWLRPGVVVDVLRLTPSVCVAAV